MNEIESKVYLDLARIWNRGPGEVEKIVRDYIGAVTCEFKPLQPYPKPHIYIRPVKLKTLKERLEEATMHADCEFCVKRNICTMDVPKPCKYRYTEDDSMSDIVSYSRVGVNFSTTYLPKTYQKKKEDNEMKATSVQKIENVKDIRVSASAFPIGGPGENLTIVIYTDDDIFKFIFEGQDLVQKCKKIGLFSGWERDQKIRKLENENKLNKETADTWSKAYHDLSKKFDELKEENDRLNKENVELIKENEKLKKELHSLKTLKKSNLPKTPITNTVLVDDYLKLAKEKEKLIFEKAMLKEENEKLKKDANEQPSSTSRADILDQAKKCVCGQREQDYGTPESNFQLIADLWNGYLFPSLQENKAVISPTDVSMMMALMKIARIRNGGGSGDSFVDLAGYAACGGELWHGQKVKDQN